MKKNNFLIFVIVFFLFSFSDVQALSYGGCEYSEITKLRSYVTNINISYDYKIINNVAYFDITLNNMVPGLYFVDSVTGREYFYRDSIDGEIIIRDHNYSSGSFKFFSALSNCYGTKINTRYYSLPTYNTYYSDPLCLENKNSTLCKKWAKISYSHDEFESLLYSYNNPEVSEEQKNDANMDYKVSFLDKFISFYTKYYYILLGSIIVVCVTIMIISKRKNRFDI